jgi:trk system potassium uptake protein
LDIRKKYDINIMALKTNDIMNLKISSDTQLLKGSTMLVLGETKHIQKCFHI